MGWEGGKKQWGGEREKSNEKKNGVEGAKRRLIVLTEFQIK